MRISSCLVLSLALGLAGCGKKKEAPTQTVSASAAVSQAPEPPTPPPTPGKEVSFQTKDGVPLKATYHDAGDAAPVVVFVHRFRGDRSEWKPVVDRLAKSERRYSILNLDLRGHGESVSSQGEERVSWASMKREDMPALVGDVLAAVEFGLTESDGKAPGVVLVGSSLGAALVAAAAGEHPKVTAVALVAPGANIEGFGVYHVFADVRMIPSFLAGAKDDNVSKMPLDALGRMAKDNGTPKTYEGGEHGAIGLLGKSPLADDLEQWLMTVFDEKPRERKLREPGTLAGPTPQEGAKGKAKAKAKAKGN